MVLAFALSRLGARNSLGTCLRRRSGKELVVYFHPIVEEILGGTLGVIAFQEQVIMLATRLAGFSSEEGEKLRRAISKEREIKKMEVSRERFVRGANLRGISCDDAEKIFNQIACFVRYGFLKGHSLALMGEIAYIAAYLKTHFPQEFFKVLFKLERGYYYRTSRPEIYYREVAMLLGKDRKNF